MYVTYLLMTVVIFLEAQMVLFPQYLPNLKKSIKYLSGKHTEGEGKCI